MAEDTALQLVPFFIATETFTPSGGDSWDEYIAWSGLIQLREVVSLDRMLCPPLLRLQDDYWPYIVNLDFKSPFFVDFRFLMAQVANVPDKNVLCVFRNPSERPEPLAFAKFEFLGYDLIDVEGQISALTNCGGFPDVSSNAELSSVGLITGLERAVGVRDRLRSLYPDEHHANCDVWAVFRMIED